MPLERLGSLQQGGAGHRRVRDLQYHPSPVQAAVHPAHSLCKIGLQVRALTTPGTLAHTHGYGWPGPHGASPSHHTCYCKRPYRKHGTDKYTWQTLHMHKNTDLPALHIHKNTDLANPSHTQAPPSAGSRRTCRSPRAPRSRPHAPQTALDVDVDVDVWVLVCWPQPPVVVVV